MQAPNFKPLPLIIPEVQDGDFGPAMRELDDKQQRFVIALIELGGGTHKYSDCAVRAGYVREQYADSTWQKMVNRLVHNEKIQAAVMEEGRRRLNTGQIIAISRLVTMLEDQTLDAKVVLKAAGMILDRTGLPVETKQTVEVNHRMSDHELVNKIKDVATRLGVDPQKLLPAPGRVIEDYVDAEIVEEEVEEYDWTGI